LNSKGLVYWPQKINIQLIKGLKNVLLNETKNTYNNISIETDIIYGSSSKIKNILYLIFLYKLIIYFVWLLTEIYLTNFLHTNNKEYF